MPKSARQSGQAILVVMLSVAAVVTIALSVVSRSVSDIALTGQEQESLRAFSAAEAGVEELLVEPQPIGSVQEEPVSAPGEPEESRYEAVIERFPPPDRAWEYVYPINLLSGEVANLWLMYHDENDNITTPSFTGSALELFWGSEGSPPFAAEVALLYQDGTGTTHTARAAYDPDPARRLQNNFDQSCTCSSDECNVDGQHFIYCANLDFDAMIPASHGSPWTQSGGLKLMQIRLLYNNLRPEMLAFRADRALPPQGRIVDSTGLSGQSQRKIQAYSLYPQIPSLFSSALFTLNSGGIIKQP